jgi:hypothetical protein
MGEKRDKRYAIRMTDEEMEMVNKVAEHYNLSNLIRNYIMKLHKDIQLYQDIAKEVEERRNKL